MKQQEDSEHRRDFSKQLACVVMGIEDFEKVKLSFKGSPFSIRRVKLASGAVRFIVTDIESGKVHDSFTFDGPHLEGSG